MYFRRLFALTLSCTISWTGPSIDVRGHKMKNFWTRHGPVIWKRWRLRRRGFSRLLMGVWAPSGPSCAYIIGHGYAPSTDHNRRKNGLTVEITWSGDQFDGREDIREWGTREGTEENTMGYLGLLVMKKVVHEKGCWLWSFPGTSLRFGKTYP